MFTLPCFEDAYFKNLALVWFQYILFHPQFYIVVWIGMCKKFQDTKLYTYFIGTCVDRPNSFISIGSLDSNIKDLLCTLTCNTVKIERPCSDFKTNGQWLSYKVIRHLRNFLTIFWSYMLNLYIKTRTILFFKQKFTSASPFIDLIY